MNAEVNSPDLDKDLLANCFKGSKFDEEWGSGEQKFIRTLFNRHLEINKRRKESGKEENNFFDDYLEHFFYEALNDNRGENQYYPRFNCKIPFLNGGLFEPYDNYDWRNTNFHIPDSIFSNRKEEFEGDGILDVFDRFNFTIAENEPFETEVAVDPEMLGKVFENLLDVKDRKSKGAFYTPREIVHYMCKESLINYLSNEIEELKREDIEQLIQMGEFTKDYDTHIFEMDYKQGKEVKPESWGMPIAVLKNVEKIDSALRNVKVADPAIGSGAFPLGMLNEIVKARSILTEYMLMHEYFLLEKKNEKHKYWDFEDKIRKGRALYNLKIDTIENSLFGVDIEPSAVEIAKLRLWLSIVVDSQNDNINPLPNLDFNFMVGNSLLDEFEGIKLFDEKLLDKNLKEVYTENKKNTFETLKMYQRDIFGSIKNIQADIMLDLEKKHKMFFKEKNINEKKKLKKEIESLEWFLISETLKNNGNEEKIKELEKMQKDKRKPYFLWKLEFAEVFKEKGGFDIVIGNPPYIGFHKVPDKEILKKNFISASGKFDFYVVFIEKAIELNNYKGSTSFICPSYFYKRDYGKNIREYILKNTKIKLLIDFSDSQIFETAQTYTCIFLTEKNNKNETNEVAILNNTLNNKQKYKKSQKMLCEPRWEILENNKSSILLKIQNKANYSLEKITKSISQGIVTGNNDVFLIPKDVIQKYNMNYEFLQKAYKGKDINKVLIANDYFLFYPYVAISENKNKIVLEDELQNKNPNLLAYLIERKEILGTRDYFNKSNKLWYELWNPRKASHFKNRKFVFSEIGNKNDFVLVDECFYTDSACGFELLEEFKKYEEYIFYFLNSKLASYIYRQISVPKANGYMIYKNAFLKDFPIYISENTKNIDFKDINQIDEMVYDLYELTEEEKEIVRQYKC